TANGGLFRSQQPPPICSLPLPFCKNQNSAVHEQRPWPSKKAAAIGSQRLARIINQIKPVGGGIQIARPCPDRPGQKSKVPEQHRAPVQPSVGRRQPGLRQPRCRERQPRQGLKTSGRRDPPESPTPAGTR